MTRTITSVPAAASFAAAYAALHASHEVADHWLQTGHQAAECASIAAHGPEAPLRRSGEHSLCRHVAFATPSGPARETR